MLALNYVTLTGTLGDDAAGAAGVFVPSTWLADTADALLIPPVPQRVTLLEGGAFSLPLLATDNVVAAPSGTWTWSVVFSGIAGVGAYGFSFFLPYADGSTQDISAIAQVPAVTPMAQYLPLSGAALAGFLAPAVVPLAFGSPIALNAAAGNVFAVTLTSSAGTLANPANPVDGQAIRVRVIQGSGGSHTLAYGSAYDFGTAGAPTLSTAAGAGDELGFEFWASKSKWCYLGASLGM